MARRPKISALALEDEDDIGPAPKVAAVRGKKKPVVELVDESVASAAEEDDGYSDDESEVSMSSADSKGKKLTEKQKTARYKKKIAALEAEKADDLSSEDSSGKKLTAKQKLARAERKKKEVVSMTTVATLGPRVRYDDQGRKLPPIDRSKIVFERFDPFGPAPPPPAEEREPASSSSSKKPAPAVRDEDDELPPIVKPSGKAAAKPKKDVLVLMNAPKNKDFPLDPTGLDVITDRSLYVDLEPIKFWRQILHPNDEGPEFRFKGLNFKSIVKAARHDDSKYTDKKLYDAARAKYTQDGAAFNALIATQMAELTDGEAARYLWLEKLRDDLFEMSDAQILAEAKKYRAEVAAPVVVPAPAVPAGPADGEAPHLAILDMYEAHIARTPDAEFKHEFVTKSGKTHVITIRSEPDHIAVRVHNKATRKVLYAGQDYTMEGGRPRISEEFENFVFGVWMADNIIEIKMRE